MALFLVFFCFFSWSTSFALGKIALGCAPPIFLTGSRMLLAGLIILAFLALFQRKELKIKKHQLFPLLLFALSAVYISNIFEFWGLQYLTAAKACFIYSLSPFLSAFFSYLEFKEKITPKKLLGLTIGFVGYIPVFLFQFNSEQNSGLALFSWPEVALLIATASAVYGWILLRKLGKNEGMSPLMTNGASMCLGGLFALIHSLFVDKWSPLPITNYSGFFQGVFLMILISNIFCYNLYGWLLKRFTATFLSFAGLLTTPLCAALFGWLLLGETIHWTFFLSVSIMSFGLWFVYSEELKLGYIIKAKAT